MNVQDLIISGRCCSDQVAKGSRGGRIHLFFSIPCSLNKLVKTDPNNN